MIRTASLRRTRDRARRSSEQRMDMSWWRISRPTGGRTLVDGDLVPDPPEVLYEGPAFLELVDRTRPAERSRDDTPLTVSQPALKVPFDAGRFLIGDLCEPIQTDDPDLVGRVWRVKDRPGDSYGVHRALPVEEVTAGG